MGLDALAEAFRERFASEPTHLARAPGRVNLIGDHTDYNDLPVMPMALQREVRIALRPRDDGVVRLANVRPEFEPVEFEIGVAVEPAPQGHWGNYVRAPAVELARRFAIWRGFDGVVASDVPVASGLSSSSALVNAVGLALAELGEVGLDSLALAEVMADAERYTGTRGGGMDQAISLGGRRGHVARIDFAPLRLRHILVPEDWRFVVADTGVRAEKSGAAQAAYNQRRSECEEALQRMAEAMVVQGRTTRAPSGYPELLALTGGGTRTVEAAEDVLPPVLLKRFRHVVTEAERVEKAADAMLAGDLAGFGSLMDASHGSLRTDYLVSTRDLDHLVAIAHEGGAAGARLTGAGFGGCIVALADAGTVESVLEALLTEATDAARSLPETDRVFLAVPSDGASFGAFG